MSLFHEMLRMRPLPSVIRFTQLRQIMKMKHYSVVISPYKQMGPVGIKDDHYTLSIMINCFCHLNHMNSCFSILGKFKKSGNEPDTVTLTSLLKGLLLEGKVKSNKRAFARRKGQ